MKFLSAISLAFCLASETLAGPVAWKDNSPRSLDHEILDKRIATVNTLPLVNPLCNGYSVSVADISSAVNQGATLMQNNVQRAKDSYPHPFENRGNLFSWVNCPPTEGVIFYEFPVLRNSPNPWLPAKNTKLGSTEPDRAIFQNVGVSEVTYCGMLTHSGAPAPGQFIECI